MRGRDRDFVGGMNSSSGEMAIIKAIVSLAQGFGLGLIAEGVETVEQAKSLSDLGCQEGQGYLFGRAVSFDEFLRQCGLTSP